MTYSLSNEAVNAEADAFTALLDGGTLEIRTDPRATNADSADTGTLLGAIPLDADSFAAAVAGIANMTVPVQVNASTGGTATWGRFKKPGGNVELDVSITEAGGGGELIIDTATVVASDPLKVVSFYYQRPKTT